MCWPTLLLESLYKGIYVRLLWPQVKLVSLIVKKAQWYFYITLQIFIFLFLGWWGWGTTTTTTIRVWLITVAHHILPIKLLLLFPRVLWIYKSSVVKLLQTAAIWCITKPRLPHKAVLQENTMQRNVPKSFIIYILPKGILFLHITTETTAKNPPTHIIRRNKKKGCYSDGGCREWNVNTSVPAFCEGNMSDLPFHLCVKRRERERDRGRERVCVCVRGRK